MLPSQADLSLLEGQCFQLPELSFRKGPLSFHEKVPKKSGKLREHTQMVPGATDGKTLNDCLERRKEWLLLTLSS